MNFQAVLVRSGRAQLHGPFGVRTVEAGDLALMTPGRIDGSLPLEPLDVYAAQFHPLFVLEQMRWSRPIQGRDDHDLFREIATWTGGLRTVQPLPDTYQRLEMLFSELHTFSAEPRALADRVAHATEAVWTIGELIREPLSMTAPVHIGHQLRDEIRQALQLLKTEHPTRISIAQIAQATSLSESALRRAFKSETGMTPSEYLHRVRIAHFEELISRTAVPLAEAARQVGWASSSHARKVFLRSYGMSPRTYRREAELLRARRWVVE
ncbi:helix-turn-helix domain-containing protein [Microbacterium keratanolyticum]